MTSPRPLNLNLMLTYRCNYRCRHCIADCGPERKETASLDACAGFIDACVAADEVATVGYTGGEPFLVPELLTDLMRHVHDHHGLPQGLVTNAFWATSPGVARRRLSELKDLGLYMLTVSLDGFHANHGPTGFVRNAVQAGLDLGLFVTVNTVVTRTGSISKKEAPRILGLPGEDSGVIVREFGPIRVGRAARLLADDEFIETDCEASFDAACGFVQTTPSLAPSGDLYACCCFGDAERGPEERIAHVGNLRDADAGTLLRAMRSDLLLCILAEAGPLAVLAELKRRVPGLRARNRYFTTCDVCVDLFLNPDVRPHLAALLDDYSNTSKRACHG